MRCFDLVMLGVFVSILCQCGGGSTVTDGEDATVPQACGLQTCAGDAAALSGDVSAAPDTSGPADGLAGTVSGPKIAKVLLNTAVLTPSRTLQITALVTDPDGAADVLGGSLLDPESHLSYGPFNNGGVGGTYLISLSWTTINQLRALNGGPRRFLIQFFDAAQHVAEVEITVDVQCDTPSRSVCSGVCVDLKSDPKNCGKCDTAPLAGQLCQNGKLVCGDEQMLCGQACVKRTDVKHCGTCNHSCGTWFDGLPITASVTHNSIGCQQKKPGTCEAAVTVVNESTVKNCLQLCATFGGTCDSAFLKQSLGRGVFQFFPFESCEKAVRDATRGPDYRVECSCTVEEKP